MKITNTVYQVDDVVGAPSVIVGDGYLTLVDAGVPNSEAQIFALIEALGRKPVDVKHILLTHSDGDHIGALPALVAATGAKVYAQRDEAEVVQGKRQSRGGKMVATPVKVDQVVKEGDVLPLHGGIRVVESFGHTLGHVCYYLLAEKLLFTGDCLTNTNGTDGVVAAVHGQHGPGEGDREEDRRARARLAGIWTRPCDCRRRRGAVEGAGGNNLGAYYFHTASSAPMTISATR